MPGVGVDLNAERNDDTKPGELDEEFELELELESEDAVLMIDGPIDDVVGRFVMAAVSWLPVRSPSSASEPPPPLWQPQSPRLGRGMGREMRVDLLL